MLYGIPPYQPTMLYHQTDPPLCVRYLIVAHQASPPSRERFPPTCANTHKQSVIKAPWVFGDILALLRITPETHGAFSTHYSLISIFDTQQFLTPPAGCSSNILYMRRWFLPSCRTPPASGNYRRLPDSDLSDSLPPSSSTVPVLPAY